MAFLTGCSLFEEFFRDGRGARAGVVAFGFEVWAFHPCDSGEQWWLLPTETAVELEQRYDAYVENPYEFAFARLKGVPSTRGEYGHLNAYQREFEVTEIVELRAVRDGDCIP